MFVIAVAVSRKEDRNQKLRIPGNKGVPIGGSVFDGVNQCYIIRGRDTLNLGSISLSFFLEMDGSPFWRVAAPVPSCILRQHLTDRQKYDLKNFEDTYASDCEIHFLQLINHNT
jgi:hypothetical protein